MEAPGIIVKVFLQKFNPKQTVIFVSLHFFYRSTTPTSPPEKANIYS